MAPYSTWRPGLEPIRFEDDEYALAGFADCRRGALELTACEDEEFDEYVQTAFTDCGVGGSSSSSSCSTLRREVGTVRRPEKYYKQTGIIDVVSTGQKKIKVMFDQGSIKTQIDASGSLKRVKLKMGDFVEFDLCQGRKGSNSWWAKEIVVKRAPYQVSGTDWPASRLEPSEDGADADLCRMYASKYGAIACLPDGILQGLLDRSPECKEYLSQVKRLQAEQEGMIATDSAQFGPSLDDFKEKKQKKYSFKHASEKPTSVLKAESRAMKYKEAWGFLRKTEEPLTLTTIRQTHEIILNSFGKFQKFRETAVKIKTRNLPYLCLPSEVESSMTTFIEALPMMLAREDLSPVAKAAWAGHHILSIHPFDNGNGRLARLIINWVLQHCNVPFFVILSGPEHLQAWRDAFLESLNATDKSKPLANLIGRVTTKFWAGLDAATELAIKNQRSEAEESLANKMRSKAKEEVCVICMDSDPDISVLCCSAVYHTNCLTRWLRDGPRPECAACRKDIDAGLIRQRTRLGSETGGSVSARVVYMGVSGNVERSINAAMLEGSRQGRQTWLPGTTYHVLSYLPDDGPPDQANRTGHLVLHVRGGPDNRGQSGRASHINELTQRVLSGVPR